MNRLRNDEVPYCKHFCLDFTMPLKTAGPMLSHCFCLFKSSALVSVKVLLPCSKTWVSLSFSVAHKVTRIIESKCLVANGSKADAAKGCIVIARISSGEIYTHSEVKRAVLMVSSAHEVRQPLLVARKTISAHRDQDRSLPIHLGL